MIATAQEQEGIGSRPRRRSGAKAPQKPAASKVKASLLLSADSSQRLSIHAAMLGLDRSALVDNLIQQHLREFYVVRKGGASTDEASSSGIGG